jgi:hypothetical protein
MPGWLEERVDFGEQERNPSKNVLGFGFVVALHLLLGWGLMNGLAQRLVEVIKSPLETKIIEEVKPPPPPPPENLPPPPKFAAPPPSFVPPPEVQVNAPPTPGAVDHHDAGGATADHRDGGASARRGRATGPGGSPRASAHRTETGLRHQVRKA